MTENDSVPEGSPSPPCTPAPENDDDDEGVDAEDVDDDDDAPLEVGYAALADSDDDEADGEVGEDGPVADNTHVAAPAVPEPLTIRLDDNIKMSAEDVATISTVMASIKLPESAIPDWAHHIQESAWLPKLVLQDTNTESTDR
ncbi:hypothetical protein HDU88_008520 [Geranomyces variabilis]|nr:hypothetical protein HDU88_008520 [Geranomyces variabilis]